MGQLACLFSSHGEASYAISKAVEKFDESLIFFDEPDMALSIRSCNKLVNLFKRLSETKQIIAAVHNPTVIAAFPEVLSLEHHCWMTSDQFIKSHEEANDTL